ncbi:hypothetical protein [Halorientalis pallida]|uniref:Uncharacterized protein n=1 Tax=Halorientalis pallida TaxID=2479928 RepID=A0A498KXV5_9EURY|nr:hypothetical protein [Halorientalis pallida]RXK46955.1 hypothetical protein EAF64_17565 [Halorientalis pallida]
MTDRSGVLQYSYDVVRILLLLVVYVALLSVKTVVRLTGQRLHRIREAGVRFARRSLSRPKSSSRP